MLKVALPTRQSFSHSAEGRSPHYSEGSLASQLTRNYPLTFDFCRFAVLAGRIHVGMDNGSCAASGALAKFEDDAVRTSSHHRSCLYRAFLS